MLITSHLPNEGTIAHRMLEVSKQQGWFQRVVALGMPGDAPSDDIGDDE
jgi:hypothetical protein